MFFVSNLRWDFSLNNYCRGAGFFSCVLGALVVILAANFGVKLHGSGTCLLYLLSTQLRRHFSSDNVRVCMFVLGLGMVWMHARSLCVFICFFSYLVPFLSC